MCPERFVTYVSGMDTWRPSALALTANCWLRTANFDFILQSGGFRQTDHLAPFDACILDTRRRTKLSRGVRLDWASLGDW